MIVTSGTSPINYLILIGEIALSGRGRVSCLLPLIRTICSRCDYEITG